MGKVEGGPSSARGEERRQEEGGFFWTVGARPIRCRPGSDSSGGRIHWKICNVEYIVGELRMIDSSSSDCLTC